MLTGMQSVFRPSVMLVAWHGSSFHHTERTRFHLKEVEETIDTYGRGTEWVKDEGGVVGLIPKANKNAIEEGFSEELMSNQLCLTVEAEFNKMSH